MPNLNPPDGRADFHQELLAIAADPKVRRLARRRTRDPELAEDVIQEALYKVSRILHPEHIDDLRAYFCRVVSREAVRLYRKSGTALLLDDPESVVAARRVHGQVARPLEEDAAAHLMAQIWQERLRNRKEQLRAAVSGRSADPDRYRDLIVAIAPSRLKSVVWDEASDKDLNSDLLDAYPEYFAQPGHGRNSCDRRFSRARADLRALLQEVVARDEILP